MSDLKSDFDTGRKSGGRKSDDTGEFSLSTTPHRSKRINLGTPANYYFKYMNSGKKNTGISFSKDNDGDTGEISIPGFNLNATPSKTETSFFSMAGSSTGSEASDDMLNKSTLSDTTELTASNFVLVTTSKQNMIRNNRDSFARVDNKENALNQKVAAVQNKPSALGDSAAVKNQGGKTDSKDQDVGIAATKNGSRAESDEIEEVHVSRQKSSIRSASPSLRSRISSSPASLRKFSENLKNSRIQRQMQREEDTKRRLSIEASDTLDSMHAQLEALTGDGVPRRDRLPPQFTRLTQPAPSQKSTPSNSLQPSPAGSNMDATATMEMGDLDDLLGMKSSNTNKTESDVTVDGLDNVTSPDNASRKEQEPLLAQKKAEEAKNTFMSNGNFESRFDMEVDQQERNEQRSTSVAQEVQPDYASPPIASPPADRSINSNARKKMTPTKLSSTPRRVVNPDSLFSPARNTRSATKKRKLAEEKQNEFSTEKVVKSRRSSSIGTRLFQMASLPDNDTSMDSDSSDNEGGMPSSHDDDTASLGDIANLFGADKATDSSFDSSTSPVSEKKQRVSDGQETASIGDINEILNGGINTSQNSPNQKLFESAHETPEAPQKLFSDENSTSIDSEDLQKKDESAEMDKANAFDSSKTLNNEENETSPNESTISAADKEESTLLMKENSESTGETQKSPNRRRNSLQEDSRTGSPDGGTKFVPKSPIRLTPNRHLKPTPTKLTPIPRRVMNPKNPNSPARNTRSSRKDKLRQDAELESKLERSTPDRLPGANENSRIEVGAVLFSNSRRQSVGVIQNKQKPPVGILSSKKKSFPRRSVAFGSPEAAEYNIGSPSVSLTPMPKGRAKALFTLPGILNHPREDGVDAGQERASSTNDDNSVGLGMDVLVDKITVEEMNGSPELSPIMKNKNDVDDFHLASGSAAPKGMFPSEEKRVRTEVEGDSISKENSFTGSPSDMRDSSVEFTDSESIASLHSKAHKFTSEFVVPFQAQRLDFSVASDISENPDSVANGKQERKAESTIELEGDMLSLLVATNAGKEDKENSRSNEKEITNGESSFALEDQTSKSKQFTGNFSIASSKAGIEGEKTVELEGNMFSLLEATSGDKDTCKIGTIDTESSEQSTGDTKSIVAKKEIAGDKTVELEGNMFSLLEATGAPKETNENDSTNGIENAGASERFTVDISKIMNDTGDEGGTTVELEGNMLSLLEATVAEPDQEETDTSDRMDISEDSSPSMLNENTTVSELFMGDIKKGVNGDKTVELEGNMFSLLQATSGGEVGEKENSTTEKMDISEDSSSSVLNQAADTEELKASLTDDNTVELDGNIISLLDASGSGPDDERKKNEKNNTDLLSFSMLKDDATQSERFTGNLSNIIMTENVSVVHSRRRSTENQLINSRIDSDSIEFDNSSNDGGRKRRKSISSNSFVVDRADEVQSIVDDITSHRESKVFEKSVSFSDTTEFITSLRRSTESKNEPEPVEVSSIASLLLEGLEFERKGGDLLSKLSSRYENVDSYVDKMIHEGWAQYFEAVCGEVQRNTNSDGRAISSLERNVQDDPRFYAMLRKRFKSSQHEEKMKQTLDGLVKAGHKFIVKDWNIWLGTVVESFHTVLSSTQTTYADDATKLEKALENVKKMQDDLSLMNDMESKHAREKSIRRQREATIKLQKEIETLEAQLSATKSELFELEEDETNLSQTTKYKQELIRDAKLYDELRVDAESSQKDFMSLNGLHSWSMKTMSETDLEFNTVGSCEQTHLKLMYEGADSGTAARIHSFKADSTSSKSLYVYREPLSGFLDTSAQRLMERAQQRSENGPVEIGEHLQKYTWLSGRLDLIAKEFQVVQRRYNGILQRQNGDVFSFFVEFESEKSTVTADFKIQPEYYPSFPIEVRLDLISGEQDLESIKKSLLKNANPGFGSLSRACDIIQSIVKG